MALARWRSVLRGRAESSHAVLLLEAVILGVVGALSTRLLLFLIAQTENVFLDLLAGYRPPHLPAEGGELAQHIGVHGLWWIPISTMLGGLITGLLIKFVAQEVKGDGTGRSIQVFHKMAGFVRARVPFATLISATSTLGSGGSAGREGPIMSIAGGLGAVLGRYTHRDEHERSLLLLVGISAGLSAMYRAPIGAAIFGVEALYGTMEFETGALVYTMIASVVSWIVNAAFVGWHSLFTVASLRSPSFYQYGIFVAVGLCAGVVSTIYPWVFFRIKEGFEKLKLPIWIKPAIGGLGVGLVAIALPQVLGGGYGWMQMIIDGRVALGVLVALVFAKMVGLALTVGSGGTGGIVAPSLFVGAALGGSLAYVLHQPMAPMVIVGMAAVLGAACRAPFTGLVIIVEMSAGWKLLPATAIAVWTSYMVQVRLSHRLEHNSLIDGQVPGREASPAHFAEIAGYAAGLLRLVPEKYKSLDAASLLRSNIEEDVAYDRKFLTTALQPGTPFVGKEIRECYAMMGKAEWEILGVLRGDRVLLPFSKLILHSGDRMAVIVSPQVFRKLKDEKLLLLAA